MTAELLDLAGNLSRFGSDEPQIAGFVEAQQQLWNTSLGSWVVVPHRDYSGFYILARDVEGDRQAREIFAAFVGPAVATLANDPEKITVDNAECRLVPILVRPDKHQAFLNALDAMTITRSSIDRNPADPKQDESNLLRDMRLAIAQQDFATAQSSYESLGRLGTLSQENMRFLRIELLAGQHRWETLVGLPYFEELQKIRRPRTVSEFMLEAIWQTRIAQTGRSPIQVLEETHLQSQYAPLLGSVDVPRSRGALSLAYLSARRDGDQARIERQLAAASDENQQFLKGLEWHVPAVEEAATDPLEEANRLYGRQQYSAVVELFLADPQERILGLAVNAVLDMDDAALGAPVLNAVRKMAAEGVQIPRTLLLLLPHLEALVSNACNDWVQWMIRVADSERWGAAASTARDNAKNWPALPASEDISNQLADNLLSAIDGASADQVRATLDLLCELASDATAQPSQRKFVDAVLLALAFQDNTSESVRNAFNDLAWAVLDSAPDHAAYTSLITTASDMWARIASLASLDWALELLDGFVTNPAPAPDDRRNFAQSVIRLSAKYAQRLEPSQILAMRSLLEELDLPPWPDLPVEECEDNPWAKLDAANLGLYTLLESAVPKLRQRLDELTHLKSFTHNKDTHGTTALKNLASSADYMIVDTWHAQHAATKEIDKVRPKVRQILPRRGGAIAFLHALRDYIEREEG